MEIKELLGKIEKLIEEQKLPQEIINIVNEIYKDYYDAYKKLLYNVQLAIGKDEKAQVELNHIVDYTNRDYEEDISACKGIEQASYIIKLEKMLENIKNVINNMAKDSRKALEGLQPIIDVEELTEDQKARKEKREEDEIINNNINMDSENIKCANQIVKSIVSDIECSKKSLIMKLFSVKVDTDFLAHIKKEFLNEVEIIKSKAILKLTPEIKQILDVQDTQIANFIIEIYDVYREEKEKPLTNRKKFSDGIHVKVDTTDVIQKIQQNDNELSSEKYEGLSGNEIE